jgi:hypothetical protein
MGPIRCPETSVKDYHSTLRYTLLFLDFLTLEDGTDTLSRNVGKGLPLDAALYPRRAQISSASRRKHEITDTTRRIYGFLYAWKEL